MPWIGNDTDINNAIDGNILDSPPAAPMINKASTVRAALKLFWQAIKTQVTDAVNSIDAVQNNFIVRSLNMIETIYVDGLAGNDSNTGAVDTSPVKTLTRVAALHSGKTSQLRIMVKNTVDVTADVRLNIPIVQFVFSNAGGLYFRKYGIRTFYLYLHGHSISFIGTSGSDMGTLRTEATDAGSGGAFVAAQGAIRLSRNLSEQLEVVRHQAVSMRFINRIVGDNSVLFTSGIWGSATTVQDKAGGRLSVLQGSNTNTITLGVAAKESVGFHGLDTFIRVYTPTSSSDANVSEGEMVTDSNFLYQKQGFVIKKIAWTAF